MRQQQPDLEQAPQQSHDKIRARPRQSHQRGISSGMTQLPEIDGHRLGITENKRTTHKQKYGRNDNGSKWIDMSERIERHTPFQIGRRITEKPCDKGMCRLMQGNGKQNGNNPDYGCFSNIFHSTLSNHETADKKYIGPLFFYNPIRAGSPRPLRTSSGSLPVRSMTVVGSNPQAPPSTTASTSFSSLS